jgi:hypothetical protein
MNIKWQPTCCAWHGDYAEHATKAGGVARLKRSPDAPGRILVCEFDASNKAVTTADGVPAYVDMAEADALALLQS